jgi:hypothetical protein
MYYIWSLIVTIIIFSAIQYKEYQQTIDKNTYNIMSFGNLSILIILYLIFTIMFYMLLGIDYNCVNKIDSSKIGGKSKGFNMDDYNAVIDPVMLRRIPDQMYTGFDPYDTEL